MPTNCAHQVLSIVPLAYRLTLVCCFLSTMHLGYRVERGKNVFLIILNYRKDVKGESQCILLRHYLPKPRSIDALFKMVASSISYPLYDITAMQAFCPAGILSKLIKSNVLKETAVGSDIRNK